jgi:type VI secretion system secreted protein Hcp
VSIYLKYEGITGSVKTKGYEGWIELQSFSFGTSRNVANNRQHGRDSGEPSLTEIHVSKLVDAGSAKLFGESVASTLNKKVNIEFTQTIKDTVQPYLKYELTDTGVSNYQISGSPEQLPIESMSLNFAKIMKTVIPTDSAASGKQESLGYDLLLMKKL